VNTSDNSYREHARDTNTVRRLAFYYIANVTSHRALRDVYESRGNGRATAKKTEIAEAERFSYSRLILRAFPFLTEFTYSDEPRVGYIFNITTDSVRPSFTYVSDKLIDYLLSRPLENVKNALDSSRILNARDIRMY